LKIINIVYQNKSGYLARITILVNRFCPNATEKSIRLDEASNLNHLSFEPNSNSSIVAELIPKLVVLTGVVAVNGPDVISTGNIGDETINGSSVGDAKEFLADQIGLYFGPMGARLITKLDAKKDLLSIKSFAYECRSLIADSISEHSADEFWVVVDEYFK